MRSLAQDMVTYSNGKRRRPVMRYEPNLVHMPLLLQQSFVRLGCDDETQEFLTSASNFSLWKLLLSDLLQAVFVSRTTANGLLGRGGMFVLSTEQIRALLCPPEDVKRGGGADDDGSSGGIRFDSLLDIGAGDGGVTAKMAPLFRKVYATEYSATMRWRLRRRGYVVLGHENPFVDEDADAEAAVLHPTGGASGDEKASAQSPPRRMYDVISCFNVLDRADKPLTLLRDMRDSLTPGTGMLLLAVVFPWCPFVEYNNEQRRPSERLPMQGGECCKGATFEDSVAKLVENVLIPCGFELVRWTRAPYLCEGNLRMDYALLNDAVFILKRREDFVDTAHVDETPYSADEGAHH